MVVFLLFAILCVLLFGRTNVITFVISLFMVLALAMLFTSCLPD